MHKGGGSFGNLGMVKIDGAMPAEKVVEAVQNKLSEFGLDLEKHVVTYVTDGASVMVKFGKIIDCDHQLLSSWHSSCCVRCSLSQNGHRYGSSFSSR